MTFHARLIEGDIHIIHQWKYANATARLAATGFTVNDLYKWAFQEDDKTYWVLIGESPAVWKSIAEFSAARPLEVDFAFADVAGGSLSLGDCDAGFTVLKAVVNILTAFNNGVTITVGDAVAQGRLMTASDINTAKVGMYDADSHYKYPAKTELFIYFPSGTPNQGSGKVIVYLL
jgi:hypothetical protein